MQQPPQRQQDQYQDFANQGNNSRSMRHLNNKQYQGNQMAYDDFDHHYQVNDQLGRG